MPATDHVYCLYTYRAQKANFDYSPRVLKTLDRVYHFADYTDDASVPSIAKISEELERIVALMEAEADRIDHMINEKLGDEELAEVVYSNEMSFSLWTANDVGHAWLGALQIYDWLKTYIDDAYFAGIYDAFDVMEQDLFYWGKLKDFWKIINRVNVVMLKDAEYLEFREKMLADEAEAAAKQQEASEHGMVDEQGNPFVGAMR